MRAGQRRTAKVPAISGHFDLLQSCCVLRKSWLRESVEVRFDGASADRARTKESTYGNWAHGAGQAGLRELLFSSEQPLCARRLRSLRDVSPCASGWPSAPEPAAFRVPPGARAPGRLGVPVASRAGCPTRVARAAAAHPAQRSWTRSYVLRPQPDDARAAQSGEAGCERAASARMPHGSITFGSCTGP